MNRCKVGKTAFQGLHVVSTGALELGASLWGEITGAWNYGLFVLLLVVFVFFVSWFTSGKWDDQKGCVEFYSLL